MKQIFNELSADLDEDDVNFVKLSNASMTFVTKFDQRNIGIVSHPTLLSYLTILKQHSLFVPFEDQRIKKYRMNEVCQGRA